MVAYVTQNTADEVSHAAFINAYLKSKHRQAVSLEAFRKLPGSSATGSANVPRLTNLMHLNVDTSWYLRFRSTGNPDLGDTFPQLINIVNRTAIPVQNSYTSNQIQAIANTAGFHFAWIEQGGATLYDAMSANASSPEVHRIVVSIGGAEVAHFQTWHDKAGNSPPLDTGDGLVFPDLSAIANKIMPHPCKFIDPNLPLCSVIRPTSLRLAGAKAAVRGWTDDGLFHGQSDGFFDFLNELAEEADEVGMNRNP
jgi:hypothetical protein